MQEITGDAGKKATRGHRPGIFHCQPARGLTLSLDGHELDTTHPYGATFQECAGSRPEASRTGHARATPARPGAMVGGEQTQAMMDTPPKPYEPHIGCVTEGVILSADAHGRKVELDREQTFMLYTTFMGDVGRTAQALGCDAVALLRVVDAEGWTEKLIPILKLRKSNEPLDFERGLNRALNFVQAHRLRLFLERTLKTMIGWSAEQLDDHLNVVKTTGTSETRTMNIRALTDFAAALEKAHAMTYMALGDTSSDRTARKCDGVQTGVADMHLKLAEAMAQVGASSTPRAKLFDSQLHEADETRLKKALAATLPPPSPLDDDDH